MIHALSAPWEHSFMVRAFLEVALIGVTGALLGTWVVLYRLAYSAESLPHAMLPGLVIAALAGVPLVIGGAAGLVVAGVCIALASRIPRTSADTGIAVVVTALLGVGVMLALSPRSPAGLESLLFGDILAATPLDVALAGGLAAIVLAALALLHWRLLAVGVDRPMAPVLGVSPLVVDALLLVLLAGAVLVAVQGLGNLLVVAVLVGPAAGARQLTRTVAPMMALATLLAVAAGFAGLYVSYYVGVAAGATIALAMVTVYLASTGLAAYHRTA